MLHVRCEILWGEMFFRQDNFSGHPVSGRKKLGLTSPPRLAHAAPLACSTLGRLADFHSFSRFSPTPATLRERKRRARTYISVCSFLATYSPNIRVAGNLCWGTYQEHLFPSSQILSRLRLLTYVKSKRRASSASVALQVRLY